MKKKYSRKSKLFMGCLAMAISISGYSQEQELKDLKSPPKNFIRNGSFDSNLKGWTSYSYGKLPGKVVKEGHDKGNCYKISEATTGRLYLHNKSIGSKGQVKLTQGKTYTLSAWFKTEGVTQKKVLFITNNGWTKAVGLGSGATTTDGWVRKTLTFIPPKKNGKNGFLVFQLYRGKGAKGTLWVDDIQIEEGSKATAFSDFWNFQTTKTISLLKGAADNIQATQDVLKETLPDAYKQNKTYLKLDKLLGRIVKLGKKLRTPQQLSKDEMANVVKDVTDVSNEVTKLLANL